MTISFSQLRAIILRSARKMVFLCAAFSWAGTFEKRGQAAIMEVMDSFLQDLDAAH